jgi:hypothetical protein
MEFETLGARLGYRWRILEFRYYSMVAGGCLACLFFFGANSALAIEAGTPEAFIFSNYADQVSTIKSIFVNDGDRIPVPACKSSWHSDILVTPAGANFRPKDLQHGGLLRVGALREGDEWVIRVGFDNANDDFSPAALTVRADVICARDPTIGVAGLP